MRFAPPVYIRLTRNCSPTREETVDFPADAAVKAFDLPNLSSLTMTCFCEMVFARWGPGKTSAIISIAVGESRIPLDWAHNTIRVYARRPNLGDLTGFKLMPQIKCKTQRFGGSKGWSGDSTAHCG